MSKYIIVKVNADTGERTYLKGDDNCNFEWVKDYKIANHYIEYDLALIDWNYAIKWYNPNGDRIFIPNFDPNNMPF